VLDAANIMRIQKSITHNSTNKKSVQVKMYYVVSAIKKKYLLVIAPSPSLLVHVPRPYQALLLKGKIPQQD